MSTYKGDSPAKKLARVEFWRRLVPTIPKEGRIVVLASREMGDYGVLKALGYGARVVAVDRDSVAAAAAAAKFPEADVRLGDVAHVVSELTESVAVAFLDFCAPLSPHTYATSRDVVDLMPDGSLFAVGLLRGREQDMRVTAPLPAPPSWNRKKRRRLGSQYGRDFVREVMTVKTSTLHDQSARGLLANNIKWEGREKEPPWHGSYKRAALFGLTIRATRRLVMQRTVSYHSRGNTNGVPMTYAAYVVDTSGRSAAATTLDHHQHVVGGMAEVRLAAISLSVEGLDSALMLNLPPGTVAAWKAHETRGTYTYKDEAAE